jgi:hypothetical protein
MRDEHNQAKLLFINLLHSSKSPLLFTSVFVSLFLSLSITENAVADVDLREGSFVTASSDLRVGHLLLQRKYNSRTLQSGAFGFGWKSDLDETLTGKKTKLAQVLGVLRDKNTHLVNAVFFKHDRRRMWRYRYQNGNLTSVELILPKKKVVLVKYQYDSLHRLTDINYGDGSHEKISYSPDQDQVVSYQDSQGCFEKYNYEQQTWGTVTKSRTSVDHRCPASPSRTLTYEFWTKKQKDGTSLLTQARLLSSTKKINLKFDRVSGQISEH